MQPKASSFEAHLGFASTISENFQLYLGTGELLIWIKIPSILAPGIIPACLLDNKCDRQFGESRHMLLLCLANTRFFKG